MPSHTDKTYESELKALREKLLTMGGKVESAIAGSVRAVIERNSTMAESVKEADREINRLEVQIDDACRRLMQSKREHKARLYFGGARCGSACVYAIIGASTRHVDPGATLRIHSGVGREIDKTENFLRRYVMGMGVDPALIDAPPRFPLAASGG